MADCCAELRSELAALRAEVARLGKVDEESIITKAFNKSKDYLEPIIGGVSAVAVAAGVKATSAYSLGEVASIKAGSAFSKATAAGKVAQVAQTTSLAAEFAAASAGARATQATGLAKVAQGLATTAGKIAAAASAFAATALGKALLALANLALMAGSIAGLFALYATLKVVFPRLDAHDRELDQVRAQIAKANSDIFGINEKIKILNRDVSNANSVAQRGLDEAYNANRKIELLIPKVENVVSSVKTLTPKVEKVTDRVDKVEPKLENVASSVRVLTPKVDEAINKANDAINNAKIATGKANDAMDTANEAISKANIAISNIATLTPKVENAQDTADYAFSTAVTIKPIALDALQEAKEVRPISEEALAKTFIALNQIKVVEPIANNALTATKLQATELKGTKLEVGKLGTVTRDHGNQIELNTKEINNLKTADKKIEQKIPAPPPTKQPDTSKQDQMNDKTLKDLQNQLNIAMTGIVGITALLKPIANNTTPASIQNNTAAGVCRTAQPGGCMSNLVSPVANNAQRAANNSANNGVLLGAISALLNAIQTIFLTPILQGVQLINKNFSQFSEWIKLDRLLNILTFITSFHNAYMLSSGLTQTLFSLVDNGVRLIVPTAPDGKPFSASEQFGISVTSLFNTLLGVETVDGIKKEWVKYNRIYQAGANIVSSVQSIMSSFQSTVDTIGSYTGKIGNSLKRFGVVGERAYGWMSENMNTRNRWLDRLEATIGTATEITSNADTVASNVLSIRDTVTQLKTQQTEFETALKAVEPAPKTDNVPVLTKNATDKQQSQSVAIALPDLDKPDQ